MQSFNGGGGQIIQELEVYELLILFMERAERLYAYVQRRIPASLCRVIAAEDILQEVWLAAFAGRSSFRLSEPEDMNRWLWKIAERRLLNAIRDARRLKRGGRERFEHGVQRRTTSYLDLFARVTSGRRTPSSEGAAKEAVHAVQIALSALPDDYRQAMIMYHIGGHSRAAVAESMHKSEGAVASLLYRGRRKLCASLGDCSKFFSGDGWVQEPQ